MIVDTPGTMEWVDSLNHKSQKEFQDLDFSLFKVDGKILGYTKSAGNLHYTMINKAGHMIPSDQPVAFRAMI